MTNLIEELQAGPGSRELSDKVLLALGWTNPATTLKAFSWHRPDGSLWVGGWAGPDPSRDLQDAVDLVPAPDWSWSAGNAQGHPPRPQCWGMLYRGMHVDIVASAPTPALALCIALIKARSL